MPNLRRLPSGDIALAVTVLTWATAFPGIRVGLTGYGPWQLGLLRLAVASTVLAVAAIWLRPARPPARLVVRVVVCALLGQTLYQGLLMAGEVSVPAGAASILIATAPVFSVIAAAWLLHEPVGRRKWAGMAIAFCGAALVAASGGLGGGRAAGLSALLVLGAALCQGLFHVAIKPLAEAVGTFAATAWVMWVGTVLGAFALPGLVHQMAAAPASATWSAVYLGVVPSAIGYFTWSFAVARTTIARSTVALYLVPVAALAVSWVWLGEGTAPVAVLGGCLAIVGVAVTRRTTVGQAGGHAREGHPERVQAGHRDPTCSPRLPDPGDGLLLGDRPGHGAAPGPGTAAGLGDRTPSR